MQAYVNFFYLGDQWLISYAALHGGVPIPTLFMIGHALEAYCKSALLKYNPGINIRASKYRHNIENMLLEIRQKLGILPGIEFYQEVKERYMTGGPIPFSESTLADPAYSHYVENQELYWVSKFQQEIKYLGTAGHGMPSQFNVTVMERNPYWIQIMRELRVFISTSPELPAFYMKTYLDRRNISHLTREYLEKICS